MASSSVGRGTGETGARPPMPDSVVAARLLPPRLPPCCLPRERLRDELLAGLAKGLCAAVAGAGWGKSTLLRLVVERAGMPTAWVSCDRRLGPAPVLQAHVTAAIARHAPEVGVAPGRGSIEDQVRRLTNVIAEVDEDIVLVLDDVHLLAGHTAEEALRRLVEDAPPSLHLALSSRTALPFPTARLRAAGMVVVGERSLALDVSETERLLAGLGASSTPLAVRRLHRRCEGWPAGLILLAHGSVRDPHDATSGEDEAFAYLAEEVFARLPGEVQRFLVDTAVLERCSSDMAAAVAEVPDAGAILARLEREHLFVVRLDGGGSWFRYHQLMQDYLRRRLSAEEPEYLRALHRRAARAWLAAGAPTEAVPHLLAAGDVMHAAALLEAEAGRMLRSAESDTLAMWLDALPAEARQAHPGLELANGILLAARGEQDAAIEVLGRAIDLHLESDDGEGAASAFLRLLQTSLAADRPHVGLAAGDRWLARLPASASSLPAVQIALATCGTWSFLRQQPEVRDLLLATALLDRFTTRMAEAASGRGDAAQLLRGLEDHGLVVRADGSGSWGRYLRPLRSFLRRHLANTEADRLAQRHRRAAAALEAEGMHDEARHHRHTARAIATRTTPVRGVASSASEPLLITSLGRLAVARDDVPIPALSDGRQKARTLLAILLCAPGAVHREQLMEFLWPHLPPPRARAALHSAVYALRRTLSPAAGRGAGCDVLMADGDAYRLRLRADDEWDVASLGSLVGAARRASGDRSLALLLRAERLLRGPFLPEWRYEAWAEERRAEVEGQETTVLEGLARALVAAGRPEEAAHRYERLIRREPEAERWHRALMEVYVSTGERARALRQYALCRTVLRERLGVEPSEQTARYHRELLG